MHLWELNHGHSVPCCDHSVPCCGHSVPCCGHSVPCCGHTAVPWLSHPISHPSAPALLRGCAADVLHWLQADVSSDLPPDHAPGQALEDLTATWCVGCPGVGAWAAGREQGAGCRQQHRVQAAAQSAGSSTEYRQQHSTGSSTGYRQQHRVQAAAQDTGSSTEYRQQHSTGSSTGYRQQHRVQAAAQDTGSSTEYRQQHRIQAAAQSTGSSTVQAAAQGTGSSTVQAAAQDTGSSTGYRQQHRVQAAAQSAGSSSTEYRQQHRVQAAAQYRQQHSTGSSTGYRQQHSTGSSTGYRQQHRVQAAAEYRQQHRVQAAAQGTGSSTVQAAAQDTGSSTGYRQQQSTGSSTGYRQQHSTGSSTHSPDAVSVPQSCPVAPVHTQQPQHRQCWGRCCRERGCCPAMRRPQPWPGAPQPSWRPGWSTSWSSASASGTGNGHREPVVPPAPSVLSSPHRSLQGALQLRQDFELVRELVGSERSGLAPETRRELVALSVFQQMDGAILCLLQQPGAVGRAGARPWSSIRHCCSDHGSHPPEPPAGIAQGPDPLQPPVAPGPCAAGAAGPVPGRQQQWLALRLHRARRWRVPGLPCIRDPSGQ
uniref:Coiled-coil protein 142 C-terminal domain-containing protein n=1 Tax=Melopsittacus undulatus TaxID=13146 RepID=A0A8V5FWV4_MELUD